MDQDVNKIEDSKSNVYKPLTYESLKEAIDKFEESDKQRIEEKTLRIKNNIKALNERAKELNKEIPMEVLVMVQVDQPIGSWFFEKYKEWLI